MNVMFPQIAVFPLLFDPTRRSETFSTLFESQHRRRPDYAAACAYDATQLLVAAVRKAGLNRARIGDAIRELSPWNGVAGAIQWDSLGSNDRAVRLGMVRSGRLVPAESD